MIEIYQCSKDNCMIYIFTTIILFHTFNKETVHIRIILVHGTTKLCPLEKQYLNEMSLKWYFSELDYCQGEKTIYL